MKRLTISMALIFTLAFAASAQFTQGVMMIGGGIQFQSSTLTFEAGSSSGDIGKTTEFSLTPQFGYFIMDNLAVGLELLYSSSKDTPDSGTESTESSVILGPFGRYYFGNIFVEAQVGFGSTKFDFGGSEFKESIFGFGIGAGYAAFLTDAIAIEPFLGYQAFTSTDKDSSPEVKTKSGGIGIGIAIQAYLGRGE